MCGSVFLSERPAPPLRTVDRGHLLCSALRWALTGVGFPSRPRAHADATPPRPPGSWRAASCARDQILCGRSCSLLSGSLSAFDSLRCVGCGFFLFFFHFLVEVFTFSAADILSSGRSVWEAPQGGTHPGALRQSPVLLGPRLPRDSQAGVPMAQALPPAPGDTLDRVATLQYTQPPSLSFLIWEAGCLVLSGTRPLETRLGRDVLSASSEPLS